MTNDRRPGQWDDVGQQMDNGNNENAMNANQQTEEYGTTSETQETTSQYNDQYNNANGGCTNGSCHNNNQ